MVYSPPKHQAYILAAGALLWLGAMLSAFALDLRELFAGAGAIGLSTLVIHFFRGQRAIDRQRQDMISFFGDGFRSVANMTRVDYDALPQDERRQFDELSSDIDRFEMEFAGLKSSFGNREIAAVIVFTFQMAIGGMVFDLLSCGTTPCSS